MSDKLLERLDHAPTTISVKRSIRGVTIPIEFPDYSKKCEPIWYPKTLKLAQAGSLRTYGLLISVTDGPYRTAIRLEIEALSESFGLGKGRFKCYLEDGREDAFDMMPMLILHQREGEDVDRLERILVKMCHQAVFLKSVVQILTHHRGDHSNGVSALVADMEANHFIDHIQKEQESFKFCLVTINKRYSNKMEMQQNMMVTYQDWLPKVAPVDMVWPDQQIWFIEVHPPQKYAAPDHGIHSYMTRLIADTANMRASQFQQMYTLKHRPVLGPTTLESDLAFLMANLGRVRRGSMVLDPFVGTGGILIPCTAVGALCTGADLDMRVIKGYSIGQINRKYVLDEDQKKSSKKGQSQTDKSQRSDIFVNFEAYGLPAPNIVRMDITRPTYRSNFRFDTIITDPPYGIRATSRTIESESQAGRPQTDIADWERIYEALIRFAGHSLVPSGRLVYLLPSSSAKMEECLTKVTEWGLQNDMALEWQCFQQLQSKFGRYIICQKKVDEPQ